MDPVNEGASKLDRAAAINFCPLHGHQGKIDQDKCVSASSSTSSWTSRKIRIKLCFFMDIKEDEYRAPLLLHGHQWKIDEDQAPLLLHGHRWKIGEDQAPLLFHGHQWNTGEDQSSSLPAHGLK